MLDSGKPNTDGLFNPMLALTNFVFAQMRENFESTGNRTFTIGILRIEKTANLYR